MKVVTGQSEGRGRGVFAAQPIDAFEVVAQVDFVREVTAESPLLDGEHYEHQIYLPDGSVHIVAEPMCFTNHSCDPNSFLYSVNRQYFVVAKKAVGVREEITIDYELSAVDGGTWECKCGAARCRGLHRRDFFSLPLTVVLENLPYQDPWFASVHHDRLASFLKKSLEGAS